MESWKPAHLAGVRKQKRRIRQECKGRAQWDWSHLKLLSQPCVYNQDNGRNPLLFVTLKIIQCLVEELLTVLLPRDQHINGVTMVTWPFATTTHFTQRDSCLKACHCH